jgi:hypothetical protein
MMEVEEPRKVDSETRPLVTMAPAEPVAQENKARDHTPYTSHTFRRYCMMILLFPNFWSAQPRRNQ